MSRSRLVFVLLALAAGLACRRTSDPDMQMTLQLNTEGLIRAESALADARDTLQKRLDQLDIGDAVVETVAGDRLSARLSKVAEPERVRRMIESPAVLELRLVRFTAGGEPSSREAVLSHYDGQLPPDLEILREELRGEGGRVTGERFHAVEKRTVVTGGDFKTARPGRGRLNEPIVEFSVKPEASPAFAEATGANIGSLLAIVLDGRVVAAPKINARISESGIIEGGFTEEGAEDLVIMLRSGPLPGRLTIVEERIVEPGGGR